MSNKISRVINLSRFVKNASIPTCKNCYFFQHKKSSHVKVCTKFGEKNVVTGEVTYEHASVCRINENICGQKGVYYVDATRDTNDNTDNLPFSNNSSRVS